MQNLNTDVKISATNKDGVSPEINKEKLYYIENNYGNSDLIKRLYKEYVDKTNPNIHKIIWNRNGKYINNIKEGNNGSWVIPNSDEYLDKLETVLLLKILAPEILIGAMWHEARNTHYQDPIKIDIQYYYFNIFSLIFNSNIWEDLKLKYLDAKDFFYEEVKSQLYHWKYLYIIDLLEIDLPNDHHFYKQLETLKKNIYEFTESQNISLYKFDQWNNEVCYKKLADYDIIWLMIMLDKYNEFNRYTITNNINKIVMKKGAI